MKTIWKYRIPVADEVTLDMPSHSTAKAVAPCPDDPDYILLWAEVETSSRTVRAPFRVIGTGNPMPDDADYYIGTVQAPPFVWHVYEATS